MTQFYQAFVAFSLLVALHVLLALSFKLAQDGSDHGYPFSPLTIMVLAEMAKFVISFTLFCVDAISKCKDEKKTDGPSLLRNCFSIKHELAEQVSERLACRVPWLAVLYCINNNIAFRIFRVVDGANVNLIKSGSSFISALLLSFVFGRALSRVQWSAVCLQVFGLVVVQFGTTCTNVPMLPLHAYALLLISLLISSTCGVWNDAMLKSEIRDAISMYTINMILYLSGFLLNGLAYVYISGAKENMFSGFDRPETYLFLFCQTFFGMAISAVYKYSDATFKTFATSCATSILLVVDILAFGKPFSLVVAMGCLTVFTATHLYATNPPTHEVCHQSLEGDASNAKKCRVRKTNEQAGHDMPSLVKTSSKRLISKGMVYLGILAFLSVMTLAHAFKFNSTVLPVVGVRAG
jgi:hypothetical protein